MKNKTKIKRRNFCPLKTKQHMCFCFFVGGAERGGEEAFQRKAPSAGFSQRSPCLPQLQLWPTPLGSLCTVPDAALEMLKASYGERRPWGGSAETLVTRQKS